MEHEKHIHERKICIYYFSPIILSLAYTHACGYMNTIVWTFFGYIYWTKNSLVSSDKIYIPIQNVQLKSKRVLPTFAQVGAKCVICEFPFFCTNKTNPPIRRMILNFDLVKPSAMQWCYRSTDTKKIHMLFKRPVAWANDADDDENKPLKEIK